MDDLKKERIERKAQSAAALESEQESRVLSLREQVQRKWTASASTSEDDLEAMLLQGPDTEQALAQLKLQRDSEEGKLAEKLALRRKQMKSSLKAEMDKVEEDLASKDPIVEEELERKKNVALLQVQQQIMSREDQLM